MQFIKLSLQQLLVWCCILLFSVSATAQKRTRILFLMDASSSMTYEWQNKQNRFEAAAKVVGAIMDSMYAVNNEVEFAVRVYGDQHGSIEKNCTDTRLVVPFNLQNAYQIKAKLKYITPLGNSPIAYSLKEAAENELSNAAQYDYSFVLITDGGENCDGNICDMYKTMIANKVKVSPYIIGLDNNNMLKQYYECLGQYVSVTSTADIPTAASLIVKNNRPLLDKPKTLNLVTPVEPKPINLIVPVVLDELSVVPSIKPYLIITTPKEPSKHAFVKNTAKLPNVLVVTTAPQLDAMEQIAAIAPKQIMAKPKADKNGKLLYVGKAKLPEALIAQKIEEGFVMQAIETNATVLPIAAAAKTRKFQSLAFIGKPKLPKEIAEIEMPAWSLDSLENSFNMKPIVTASATKKPMVRSAFRYQLPKEITEVEMPMVEMQTIATINKAFSFANNSIAQKPNAKNKFTYSLPKEITEQEFVAIDMKTILPARSIGTTITAIDAKVGKARKTNAYILPDILFIPPFEEVKMEDVYAIPFRYSYQFAPLPIIRPRTKISIPAYPKALIAKKKALPIPPVNNEKAEFKIETEPSADTRLAVYFTDGAGKFYNAKPMVALVDPNTKQNIKTFMRDVYENGDPEPVKLDIDGVFDVTVLGQRDIVLNNVPIEKNKLNKVILKVTNGTLIFTYQNNRTRAVDKTVRVRRLFSGKKIPAVMYNAMEQKMFEPGEYQIELDILPKYVLHTEVSFGAITEVQIPQEGEMYISTDNIPSPVTLYWQTGDTYEEFITIAPNSTEEKRRLLLRPGSYKASFVLPGMPKMAPPTIVSFLVKANQETTLELKDYKGLTVTPDAIGKPVYIDEAPKVEFINANPLLDGKGKEIPRKKK
jgi:hypothetical protein